MNLYEHLWNGWRAEYVRSIDTTDASNGPSDAGSVFTRLLNSGLSDSETHIVHRGQTVFAIMNAFPYGVGHLLVLPYREVANLEDLTPSETAEIWSTATNGVRALKTAYNPHGINLGVNLGRPAGGSISEHLHVHVVPRWTGDANFITTVANARTLPEPLAVTASKLRDAWLISE